MAPAGLRSLALIGVLLGRLCDTADDVSIEADGQVHVLTQDNFAASVGKFPYTFVEFYAPWCGHCKKLEPEWDKTAQLAGAYDIAVAKVDAIVEEKLAQQHSVQSFPTLFLFKGTPAIAAKYNGPRDATSMAAWLGKWTQGELMARPEASEEGVKAWAQASKVKLLGVLSGKAEEDKPIQKLLEAAAFMLNPAGPGSEVPVGLAEMPGGELSKLGVSGVTLPCVALLRDFDFEDKTLIYQENGLKTEADEVKSFMSWLEVRSAPRLIPASKETEKLFLSDIEPGHAIALLFGSDEGAANQIHKLAIEMTGSTNKLKWVHAKEDEFGKSLAKSVGLEGMNFPDFVLWEFGESEDDDHVYKLSQQDDYSILDADNFKTLMSGTGGTEDLGKAVGTFIERWVAGLLSAEVDPVITLTSDSFEAVVLDASKDVLVEFYAPWCGHCKALAPEYKEVAKHYADDGAVAIAKMDSTQHSHPSVTVKSYPTLYFYQKSNKHDPVLLEFEANRDKASLIELVEEHRETSFTKAKKSTKTTTPTTQTKPAAKKPAAKKPTGKFKEVPCPDDADIFACSKWCEMSSSDEMQLVGTLGGKSCEDWHPSDKVHDETTCTCYDVDFTDAFLNCKSKCKKARAKGGKELIDDGEGTCAAGDASCSAGSTKEPTSPRTTTPTTNTSRRRRSRRRQDDMDDDIAADF